MDPNETMGQEPVNNLPETESDEVRQEEPLSQEQSQSGSVYRGVGAGQKESPFASSPYYTAAQTRQSDYTGPAWEQTGNQDHNRDHDPVPNQDRCQYQPPYQPEPFKEKGKKPRKKMGGKAKAAIAAALAVVLMAGSCGITAAVVNNRWEKEMEQLQVQVQEQIAGLQTQLDSANAIGSGTSVSGSPLSAEGLTPSQVYAMNVNSVVSIGNYATVSGSYWGNVEGQQLVGSGSGFIISEDGYVITNYHVVEGAQKLTVTTYIGDEYEATLIGYDELNDVALLKVDATGLDPVQIGSSDDLIVGDMVVAIGNPLGDELASTQTVGYISGKDRSITTDGSIINMLQTDAAINSGNSGGPLFNMKGEVVGITSAKYSGSSSSGATIEGIGFAIPIDDVMSMIDDLRDYGYLRNQAYLGVTVRDMDSATASMYSLPAGSYVDSVVEGGSADRAGIQPKDIIIAVGEHEVGGNTELSSVLRRFKAGDTTTITVYRSGQELVLDITFDEKPQVPDATEPTTAGEMPENGSYEDWYRYFFGEGNG